MNSTSLLVVNQANTASETVRISSKSNFDTAAMVFFAFLALTAILAVGLNTYVLTIFYRGRNVKSISNIPLITLAVADLQSGLVNIPLILATGILPLKPRSQYFILIRELSRLSTNFSAATTISNLFVVVVLRYLSIYHPIFSYGTKPYLGMRHPGLACITGLLFCAT